MDSGKTFVAGHKGLVGGAVMRALERRGVSVVVADRAQIDLRKGEEVDSFFQEYRPEVVYLAAAKVGGILANSERPVDFLLDNLQIQSNVISSAHRWGVQKFIFFGSSCIYPRLAEQPIAENSLLTGPLEPTNEWYAIAKIAGIKLCQAFRKQYGFRAISLMPTNLYGPGDNFDLHTSHVLPALIRKFHLAKINNEPKVVVWGTGTPRREFMHVDDLADAALFLAENYDSPDIINVGVGDDISISELGSLIASVVGYAGAVSYDLSKPDGTPRKLLNVDKLQSLGWKATIPLKRGIEETYSWFLSHKATADRT